MRKYIIALTAALTLGTAISSQGAQEILTNYQFGRTNPLATGKWVKISIQGSGIYEITYDELREMGFSDPSGVAVYGLGGLKRNLNFLSSKGERLVEDEIKPVPVLHGNGKLIFYGLGDRKLVYSFNRQGSTFYPKFYRDLLNTSSDNTYYMLTDSHPIATPAVGPEASASAVENETAHGCYYHETEQVNGISDSGEFWWGETVTGYTPYATNVTMPYAAPSSRVSFYCDYAITGTQLDGSFVIKLNGNTFSCGINKNKTQVYGLYSHSSRNKLNTDDTTHKGTASLEFSVTGLYGTMGFDLGIDYWIMAYDSSFRYIDDDPGFSQFTAGFDGMESQWKHYAPAGTVVWDITDPMNPVSLRIKDGYFHSERTECGSVVVFNPSANLKRINEDYETVANQDIHSMQDTAYDMVIFTVPKMRKYAERIADLHKRYDGIDVAIFTNDEIFNEFNAGTPEPICYRMATKMLYQHPEQRLKNVLFLGPIYGDYRNIMQVRNRPEGMIGFQDNIPDLSSCSNLAMDYYGIMTDNLQTVTRLDGAPITLGVGVLPIDTDYEGEIAVSKIRAYLEKKDFSSTVNSTYSISCEGDYHLHEKQSIGFGETVKQIVSNNLNSEFAHETLWTEPLEPTIITARIQDAMRRGKALIYYYGHSIAKGFTGFNTYDSMTADNKELGMMFYGGCDLTKMDRGVRGSGDAGVTRTKNGFIGILASTRTAMSNHNESLGNNLLNSMFFGRDNKWLKSTPTIGEVVARAKENTSNNSELSYVYVGDPALRIPVALTPVKVNKIEGSYRSGNVVTVRGTVTDLDGNASEDYNGYVTVTLMEPARMVTTPEPADPNESKMPDYVINDLPILSVKGTVSNGRFTVKLPLPDRVDAFLSDADLTVTLPILVGTWDHDKKLGGSGKGGFEMAAYNAAPDAAVEKDATAPSLTLHYDNDLGVLTATAIENVAMLPGIGAGAGMTLTVDGVQQNCRQDYNAEDAVTSFIGNVNVAYLSPGKHTARLTGTDLCGNTAGKVIEFIVTEPTPLQLSTNNTLAAGEIEFSLQGIAEDKEYELIIIDQEGNVVSQQIVNGMSVILDTADLANGVYRAYAHHASAGGRKANSNEIEFTVI